MSWLLYEVDLDEVEIAVCMKQMEWPGANVDHICTYTDNSAKDICGGDSGGPVMTMRGGRFFSVGVINYGSRQCVWKRDLSVHSRVTSYLDWIDSHTKNANWCKRPVRDIEEAVND